MFSQRICSSCGQVNSDTKIVKGSFVIEAFLYLIGIATLILIFGILILVVAVIYSIWRVSSSYRGCKFCRTQTIVDINSPMGQELVRRFHPNQQTEVRKEQRAKPLPPQLPTE